MNNFDNKVLVEWGHDTLIILNNVVYSQKSEMTIDSSGVLSYPEYFAGGHTYFYQPAYIKNDSIKFNFGKGRLGLWVTWSVNGTKNK